MILPDATLLSFWPQGVKARVWQTGLAVISLWPRDSVEWYVVAAGIRHPGCGRSIRNAGHRRARGGFVHSRGHHIPNRANSGHSSGHRRSHAFFCCSNCRDGRMNRNGNRDGFYASHSDCPFDDTRRAFCSFCVFGICRNRRDPGHTPNQRYWKHP